MQRGFTLAEILIAVFILSILMATILGTFTGIISSAREAETRSELYQTGRALMDLITTDIRCLYPTSLEGGKRFFRGSAELLEGETSSSMSFVTTNALTMGKVRNPFLSEVTYRLTNDPDGPGRILWRRSQSPAVPPYDEGGRTVPVCRAVERFQLEFIYKDARKKDLIDVFPEAVVVRIELRMEGHREAFVTMARPMISIEEAPDEDRPSSPSG